MTGGDDQSPPLYYGPGFVTPRPAGPRRGRDARETAAETGVPRKPALGFLGWETAALHQTGKRMDEKLRHAVPGVAATVVVAELSTITWIRNRYMETPVFSAAVQVGLGGALVFLTGVLIGNS